MTRPLALLTGPTAGIGRPTALALARAGYDVLLACRNPSAQGELLDTVRAQDPAGDPGLLPLDLGSLRSVRACADLALAHPGPLRLLVNNAGLAGRRAAVTEDGFEETVGVNHLGHYLLTRLVLPKLLEAPGARVVHVSSRAHKRSRRVDWEAVQGQRSSVIGLDRYAQSKLANVLFSNALARRYPAAQLASFALHPGVVATDIWRRVPGPLRWFAKLFMISAEEGAATTLFAALDPGLAGRTGLYLVRCKEAPMNPAARDEAAQELCWARSAALVGLDP